MADINTDKAGPTANSYASTDDADDYLESVYGSEDWAKLTDAQKEQLLMTATRQLDRLKTNYPSATTTQRLKFPLDSGTDDGFDQAKEATILQAHYLLQYDDELKEAQGNQIQGVKDQKIGPSLSRSSNGLNAMAMISPEAIQILRPFIDLTVRVMR